MVPPLLRKLARRASGPSRSLVRAALALPFLVLSVQMGQATTTTIPDAEKKCLATAIYFEARGEPKSGQAAVAQVILNRVEAQAYPDTICEVVYQNREKRNACQFSFACDGKPDVPRDTRAWARAKQVGSNVLDGRDLIAGIKSATHYHADYVSPYWAPKMRRLSKVGRHIFYQA